MKTLRCNRSWTRVLLLSLFILTAVTLRVEAQVTIQLVSARDHIEGSFTTPQSIYADRDRIYLASFQGKLFVLARDRAANFPVIEVVQDTTAALTAVRGDSKNLYVTSVDGNLRVYRKEDPLVLIDTISLSGFGLSSVAPEGNSIYVSRGQASLAVDRNHVYLSELNEGDIGLEIGKRTLTPELTFGETFEPNTTIVFDRRTGDRVGGITNPPLLGGGLGVVSLYADKTILALTTPGCCGLGIFIYDPDTLTLDQAIGRHFTNTVVRSDSWLIAGNEGGQVDVFDLGQNPSPLISTVDLRLLTGHTGIEDIEIRALWKDKVDDLVFAGSSWGNDQSRGPTLPSFFVLELVKRKQR